MEAGRVLRLDEVQIELRLALEVLRGSASSASVLPAAFAALRSAISSTSASIATLRSLKVRSWIVSTRAFSSSSRPLVAGLAGAIDVEQRAAHVVVADLQRALALVGHVAIGAGHARARVDALVPHLELRVLRLEHRRAGVGVRPVLEAALVVVSQDLVRP